MENKVGGGCLSNFYQRGKPYIAMISLQFGYAGMNVITKVSLNGGMSHYVLVVYRHAIATLAIAPFALLLERKLRPKMTFMMFLQIFILGLLGPVIDQNFYYAGLKFTSPTFSCAMSNMLPAMTFVMAVLCRMEKVHIKKLRCQAKVVGTVVTVAGAMLMTLYKGHVINLVWSNNVHTNTTSNETSDKDWLKGSMLLIGATFAWASFFILQAITMRKYTAPLSLTALVCFMGTLQSIAVTLVMEHKPSAWAIGFDMNLLAAAYAGIVSSSLAYYVQGLVMEKRGPVFVTAFSPLMMIIVAIMGSFILSEKIYLGGVLGAVLIVAGLYSVLWGKYKEYQEKEIEGPVKGVVINDIEMQKSEVVIGVPMQQPPILAKEVPRA
ncbi:WAT1-related protein At5g07050-like [Solanum dulcamara]|uniref:WAT1-related protein At5g07050-like n=1 Tax=Solanum dulcamara TaxID=45834 RepID=UPI0024863C24|nr:WAT1-related protein At5g07050-like [Solanum dulcamara]